MWKTGVVARGPHLEAARARPEAHRLAFTLLEEFEQSYSDADEPVVERIYNQLRMGGNVYKTTRKGRFRDLDAKLADEVSGRFADAEVLRVHDVGSSSAITSLELFEALNARRRAAVHASDLYDSILVVSVTGSPWRTVFDLDGHALQYVGRRFVLSALEGESRRVPFNRWLQQRLDRKLLPRARTVLEAAALSGEAREAEAPGGRVRRILLIHPSCHAALSAGSGFTYGRHDVFEPAAGRFHLIRAVNVLNPGYFDDARLTRAVEALAATLEPGGLLLVGRTIDEEDRRTRATLLTLKGGGFTPVWRVHDGAENEALVAAVSLA